MHFSPSRQIIPDFIEAAPALYEKYKLRFAMLAAFLIPIKLVWVYFPLFSLILLWLVSTYPRWQITVKETASTSVPLFLFIIFGLMTSVFGVNPLRSFEKLAPYLFYACIILTFYKVSLLNNYLPILLSLIAGQSIAATYSVLQGAFALDYRIFLGAVTESGQLALMLLITMGTIAYIKLRIKHAGVEAEVEPTNITEWLYASISFFLLLSIGFAPYLSLTGALFYLLLIASIIFLGTLLRIGLGNFKWDLKNLQALHFLLVTIAIPLLTTALLVNLKRGPWAGVIVGTLIFLLLFSRKWVLPLFLIVSGLVLFIEPVKTRLESSAEHFYISGGRNVIWNIGSELSMRYPLGVGFKNSSFLQQFSPEVPPELSHFHSNALNILVELGWLGLWIYLWWIFCILRLAFRKISLDPASVLACSIGCAVISWQVAGVVEYSFGDSKVFLLVLMMLGILSAVAKERDSTASQDFNS